jgi:hypothetical protein
MTGGSMPYVARKHGNRWAIVNKATGRVAGYSSSKRKAQQSASIRNRSHSTRRSSK